MSYYNMTAVIVLAMTMMALTEAHAQTGAGGCSSLPEYYRALGALQGMESCDMSIEQARRIAYGYQAVAPTPRPRSRRHPVPVRP